MQPISSVSRKGVLTWIFRGILLVALLFLWGRLAELQVVKGEYYRNLAEGNRIRRVPIAAARGEIHARGGEILVGNSEVVKTINFTPENGFEKTDGGVKGNENTIVEWERRYDVGPILSHVTGYLSEAREDEVGKINPDCNSAGVLKLGSLIGRTGLEEKYECTLAGKPGEQLFEVDSTGALIRRLGDKPATKGLDIITNIDIKLQSAAREAMGDKVGAVVVSDGKGEVLALLSTPSYDPNWFGKKDKAGELGKLFTDPAKPFFNRAIGGTYHPGSVFKPLVGAAALSESKITRDFTFEDTGQIVVKTAFGDFAYRNWYFTQYGGAEGAVNLERALARSTDTYFYKIGEFLGPDKIAEWAKNFGLADKTGIDLTGEVAGLVPTPAWKKEAKGENWFLGNTYHYSIGQGDLAVTPLGINTMIAAIATGELCTPTLVGEVGCKKVDLSEQNRDIVLSGMKDACTTGGTAVPFFEFPIPVFCKTGTAETGVNDKTHAWFTIIAPYSKDDTSKNSEKIIMTVLVEEGGEGSKEAAPIAKKILDNWYGIEQASDDTTLLPEGEVYE